MSGELDRLKLSGLDAWLGDNVVEVETVYGLLSEKLSDNPVELNEQLAKAEAWHARMTSLLADANTFLDLAEQAALAGRQEKLTDLDRKVNLAATVAQERRLRDKLDGICKSIDTRLMLGMSMVKRMSGERQKFNG